MKPSPQKIQQLAFQECSTNIEKFRPLRKGRFVGLLVLGLVGVVAIFWIGYHLLFRRRL